VGVLNVAGMKYEKSHAIPQDGLWPQLPQFELSASLGRLRSIQIFVVGQAKRQAPTQSARSARW